MARPRKERPVSCAIFQGADGVWHGYLTVGTRPDGRPDRRHRTGKTEMECAAKIRALEEELAAGKVRKPGRVPTVEQWMKTWLDEIVIDLRYSTRRGYEWASRLYIVPRLGGWRLDELQAKHIEQMYRDIARKPGEPTDKGLGPSSVHTVHRALRAALHEALRRDQIKVNPMDAVRSPELDEEEISPLLVDEVRRIIAVCLGRRNGTRWIVGLAFGLRQGEALGLPWIQPVTSTRDKPEGLDLDDASLTIRSKAERRRWQHGCADPHACGETRHRFEPCPPSWEHGCADPVTCHPPKRGSAQITARLCPRRHKVPCRRHPGRRGCPPPCPRDCTAHASRCPDRTGGGIVKGETKSRAGRRRIKLPEEIVALLRTHRAAQAAEKLHAGTAWTDHGLVWCQPIGAPIDARRDWAEWKDILREARVRDARVHDGRHTAATILLLLKVDQRTVMATMGWSDGRMLHRYQHVVDELLAESAQRVGAFLFGATGEGSATDLATARDSRSRHARKKRPAS